MHNSSRLGGGLLLAGLLLFAGAVAFHPPLLELSQPQHDLRVIGQTPWYTLIHWLMAAGMLLLVAGLLALVTDVDPPAHLRWLKSFVVLLLGVQWALWLVLLVFEAQAMTALATSWRLAGEPALRQAVAVTAWALGTSLLLLGYVAAVLLWAGIGLWAGLLRRLPGWQGRGTWGMILSGWAILGLIGAVAQARWGVPILVATQGPSGLWVALWGWRAWRGQLAGG